MGVANLTQIVTGLRPAGLADDLPAAVVERGFSDSQRTTVTTVERLAFDARRLRRRVPCRRGDRRGGPARRLSSAESLPLVELRAAPGPFRSARLREHRRR